MEQNKSKQKQLQEVEERMKALLRSDEDWSLMRALFLQWHSINTTPPNFYEG